MNNQKMLFGVFIGALLLVLGGMILHQESVLSNGERVILKTAPVDPRDIFRGDYVILRYDIQDQAKEMMEYDFYIDGEKDAYLTLDTSQKVAVAKGIWQQRPDEGLYLKGPVHYRWDDTQDISFPDLAQYYVPEGKGLAVEALRREGELYVEVSVANGKGRITRLLDQDFNEVVVGDLD